MPLLTGYRMSEIDVLAVGNRAEEVTRSYEEAWKQFGRVGKNGHYHIMLSQDTRAICENVGRAPWVDAWCGALLNMWNRDFVHAHYPSQIEDLVKPGPEGTLSIVTSQRPLVMGQCRLALWREIAEIWTTIST